MFTWSPNFSKRLSHLQKSFINEILHNSISLFCSKTGHRQCNISVKGTATVSRINQPSIFSTKIINGSQIIQVNGCVKALFPHFFPSKTISNRPEFFKNLVHFLRKPAKQHHDKSTNFFFQFYSLKPDQLPHFFKDLSK